MLACCTHAACKIAKVGLAQLCDVMAARRHLSRLRKCTSAGAQRCDAAPAAHVKREGPLRIRTPAS